MLQQLSFTIPLAVITKKNHTKIIWNKRLNRPMVIQSDAYKAFEKACGEYIPQINEPFSKPVNIKCHFYMATRRQIDLTNALSSVMDILVKYGVIVDDNRDIAAANDGSRVYYDKYNPRIEISIELLTEQYDQWKEQK